MGKALGSMQKNYNKLKLLPTAIGVPTITTPVVLILSQVGRDTHSTGDAGGGQSLM